MKHSAQIVTLSAQRLAYGSMPLEPAKTRARSNFPEPRNLYFKVRFAELNTDVTILMPAQTLLAKPHLKYTSEKFKGQKLDLMSQKSIYPYHFMDSFEKFYRT